MTAKFIWFFTVLYSILPFYTNGSSTLKRPKAGDPFDTFPKNFWQEFSSPFTEVPEEDDITITESTTHDPFPYFAENFTTVNVSAQLGSHVYLHCRVNYLQGKTVSWVRRKGDALTLITFGLNTYSTDSRYLLEFEDPNNWKLCIKYANDRDQGIYECQVSSHPPLVLLVNLHVIVPVVEIFGEGRSTVEEKYYKAGSTIELHCVISNLISTSVYVTWKHNNRMLNYDTRRGGISVKTDLHTDSALSRLYVANADTEDSGKYTCMLNSQVKATVNIHVIRGEEPAAMQHSNSNFLYNSISILLILQYVCWMA